MSISTNKYNGIDSQDTPIIKYIKVPEYETRFGCNLGAFLGPLDSAGILRRVSNTNKFDCNFAGVKSIESSALYARFYYNSGVRDVFFPDLETIWANGLYCGFRYSGIQRFIAPKLSDIKMWGLYYAFADTSIKTVDLSGIKVLTVHEALSGMFNYCRQLESVDLSNLTEISGGVRIMSSCFSGSGLKTMTFPKLRIITGSGALSGAFSNSLIETISFPALVPSGLTTTNVFSGMLGSCSGVTVHFPSNIESVISSWTDVQNGFGGTNTTILYDLPATE